MNAVATGSSIRCAVAADGGVRVETRPRPRADSDGTVLVRPTLALATRLEREVARGLGTASGGARALGTSCVGVVEDASRAGGLIAAGTRVAIQPVFSCGRCERCMGGLAMHCGLRTILGVDDASGGMSELLAIPAAACAPLPRDLDDELAVFAVPLARAVEAVRRSGVDKRTYASVLGDDLLAVLTTLVAVEENQFARLVATSDATLRMGEQFGIRHRALAETGRRGDQEIVIDTTGSAETIVASCRMARARGHVVVAGISARAPVAVDLSQIALDEIEVHGSGFGPLGAAIERLARRAIDPSPLISRRVGLADAPKAIAMLAEPDVFSVLVQVTR
ncbi:MAG: 2-deoxy-scyllo-inosamine dehydrogenase [Planctomycetota bacterium]|jgi:threonine dehydrogenase-like Zn-dependent dehydrogenase